MREMQSSAVKQGAAKSTRDVSGVEERAPPHDVLS